MLKYFLTKLISKGVNNEVQGAKSIATDIQHPSNLKQTLISALAGNGNMGNSPLPSGAFPHNMPAAATPQPVSVSPYGRNTFFANGPEYQLPQGQQFPLDEGGVPDVMKYFKNGINLGNNRAVPIDPRSAPSLQSYLPYISGNQ